MEADSCGCQGNMGGPVPPSDPPTEAAKFSGRLRVILDCTSWVEAEMGSLGSSITNSELQSTSIEELIEIRDVWSQHGH